MLGVGVYRSYSFSPVSSLTLALFALSAGRGGGLGSRVPFGNLSEPLHDDPFRVCSNVTRH